MTAADGRPTDVATVRLPARGWTRATRAARAAGVTLVGGLALVGSVALGGCAIPEDSKPQAVERVSLPPQLVDPPSTTVPQPASETQTRSVYLVKAATSPDGTDSLQPVRTQVRVPSDPADAPRAVIDQLLGAHVLRREAELFGVHELHTRSGASRDHRVRLFER